MTLVSDRPEFVFKPYLSYVPFGLQPTALQFDLRKLAEGHGFSLREGTAHAAAPEAKTLRVNGTSHAYDALFIATGATAGPEAIPGLHAHAYMLGRTDRMKPLCTALRRLCSDARSGAGPRIALLMPPGCQWAGGLYELAFILSTWLSWKGVRENIDLMLLTAEEHFMEAFGPGVHETLQQELRDRGISGRSGPKQKHWSFLTEATCLSTCSSQRPPTWHLPAGKPCRPTSKGSSRPVRLRARSRAARGFTPSATPPTIRSNRATWRSSRPTRRPSTGPPLCWVKSRASPSKRRAPG